MRRGDTATLTINSPDIDLTTAEHVYITMTQANGYSLTKRENSSGVTLSKDKAEVELSQEETLTFDNGKIQVQIRGINNSGKTFSTNIDSFRIGDILLDGVIK